MPTEINGYSPSQETVLSSLIINEVDSNETFDKMKEKGLLQDNQLYLVTDEQGGGTYYTTGEVDALLQKEADIMKKVWENAAPTSTFVNQTVQIDLTMYPIVAVEDTDGVINYFANPTTSSSNLITIVGGGNIAAKIYKRMCKVGAGGIAFGSCVSISTLNQTTSVLDDSKCIPLNIYGITM